MESFENIMRGSVRAEITGLDTERFLNLCAQNGVPFWDTRKTPEGALRVSFTLKNWRAAKPLAEKAMCQAELIKTKGAPLILRRIRARVVLIAGLLACVFGMAAFSMFIWEIDVTGESSLTDGAILSALEEAGVGIGTFGLSVDSELLRSRLLLELPELKWISVNVFGSRAVVSVRDRTLPPEVVDLAAHCDLTASKPGLIESVSVYSGKALVNKGDTVLPGEILVSGSLPGLGENVRTVHSMADIYARTWYELSAEAPLSAMAKSYTGEEFTRRALYIAGRRINLYFNGGITLDGYDKITERSSLAFKGGFTFPISLETERYRAYETFETELSPETAAAELEEGLMNRLMAQLDGGELLEYEFETRAEDGMVTVTLKAECLENIAAEAPLSGAGTAGEETVN